MQFTNIPSEFLRSGFWLRYLALGISLLLIANRGWGTTVVPPDFDDLVGQADYVVHALVKSVNCEWRTKGVRRSIITKVELEVSEVIAGSPPSPLILEMLGGQIEDERMVVQGAPEFKVGDEDILFVHGNGRMISPLVALTHGRYPVKRDPKTGRSYVTRSNGEPLYDAQDVVEPMTANGVHKERAATVEPLSPDSFASKIRLSKQNNSPHS